MKSIGVFVTNSVCPCRRGDRIARRFVAVRMVAPKHLAVLNAAAEKGDWGKPLPAGVHRGIAQFMGYGSYSAATAASQIGKPRLHVGGPMAAREPRRLLSSTAFQNSSEEFRLNCRATHQRFALRHRRPNESGIESHRNRDPRWDDRASLQFN